MKKIWAPNPIMIHKDIKVVLEVCCTISIFSAKLEKGMDPNINLADQMVHATPGVGDLINTPASNFHTSTNKEINY